MNTINIGIIGLGTVASGLVEGIIKNSELIKSRFGLQFNVRGIAVRDLGASRQVEVDESLLTDDASKVISDEETQVILELMGGTTKARELVIEALKNGKAVVTANKALIAEHGPELFALAEENKTSIYFEASVAGGIPIIKALREGLSGNDIQSIQGILNGTCNFILSEMELKGAAFDDTVKLAQDMGYAEADPTLDVGGFDAGHKTAILASLVFGKWFDSDAVAVTGIDNISLKDMAYAKELGYRIKLIGHIDKNADGKVYLAVKPTLVPLSSTMANVNDVFNGVRVKGDIVGETMFYGQGAGKDATASAVYADLIDASKAIVSGTLDQHPGFIAYEGCTGLMDQADHKERYYLRFKISDKPMTLSTVTRILGENQISISSVHSKDIQNKDGLCHVIILTHEASLTQIDKAISELTSTKDVVSDVKAYSIHDLD